MPPTRRAARRGSENATGLNGADAAPSKAVVDRRIASLLAACQNRQPRLGEQVPLLDPTAEEVEAAGTERAPSFDGGAWLMAARSSWATAAGGSGRVAPAAPGEARVVLDAEQRARLERGLESWFPALARQWGGSNCLAPCAVCAAAGTDGDRPGPGPLSGAERALGRSRAACGKRDPNRLEGCLRAPKVKKTEETMVQAAVAATAAAQATAAKGDDGAGTKTLFSGKWIKRMRGDAAASSRPFILSSGPPTGDADGAGAGAAGAAAGPKSKRAPRDPATTRAPRGDFQIFDRERRASLRAGRVRGRGALSLLPLSSLSFPCSPVSLLSSLTSPSPPSPPTHPPTHRPVHPPTHPPTPPLPQAEHVANGVPVPVFAECGRIIAAEWRGMSDAAKAPYVRLAAEDQARYDREMAASVAVLPPGEVPAGGAYDESGSAGPGPGGGAKAEVARQPFDEDPDADLKTAALARWGWTVDAGGPRPTGDLAPLVAEWRDVDSAREASEEARVAARAQAREEAREKRGAERAGVRGGGGGDNADVAAPPEATATPLVSMASFDCVDPRGSSFAAYRGTPRPLAPADALALLARGRSLPPKRVKRPPTAGGEGNRAPEREPRAGLGAAAARPAREGLASARPAGHRPPAHARPAVGPGPPPPPPALVDGGFERAGWGGVGASGSVSPTRSVDVPAAGAGSGFPAPPPSARGAREGAGGRGGAARSALVDGGDAPAAPARGAAFGFPSGGGASADEATGGAALDILVQALLKGGGR